jgi:L-fuconolactonase
MISTAIDVPVVDAQVHVWAESTPQRPWPENGIPVQRVPALGVDELLQQMKLADVDRAVLVPPMWEGPRNDLALAAAQAKPTTFAVMGRLDPVNAVDIERLASWRSEPGMLGVRVAFNRGDALAQLNAAADSGFFGEAARHGIPIMIYPPGLCERVAEIAAELPDLHLVIDHVALTEDAKKVGISEAIRPVLRLSSLANVAVKASALPCYLDEPYPFPSAASCVNALLDAFGSERVFWGSDYSRLPCGYSEWRSAFTGYLTHLDDRERGDVLGGAILRWLGWST